MLFFNIKRILEVRGIDQHYRWLVSNGFVPQTATTWLKHRIGYIKPDHMERLCHLLNCTPNDLFEWRADANSIVPDGHALHTLKHDQPAKSFAQMTHDIPADKMEKLREILAELKGGEDANG